MRLLRPRLAQACELYARQGLTLAVLGLSACGAAAPAGHEDPPAASPAPAPAEPAELSELSELSDSERMQPATLSPELRAAGQGPVAALVAAELRAAEAEHRTLVVYLGAPWCEPCVAFHDALLAGELNTELPATRFLEFNMDRDQERLAIAGYTSRLIPLFVLPQADGSAGSRRIEGGIKGPGAVQQLTGRLGPLLAD